MTRDFKGRCFAHFSQRVTEHVDALAELLARLGASPADLCKRVERAHPGRAECFARARTVAQIGQILDEVGG